MSKIKQTASCSIASSSSSSSSSIIAGSAVPVAVIEMASAAGLDLMSDDNDLDPLCTTTFGVGQLIQRAYDLGARRIIVGVGGSATNDGGLGCLQALGVRVFVDGQHDEPVQSPICGGDIGRVTRLELPSTPILDNAVVEVACDVDNPFVGERGAVAVFSAQKGADEPRKKQLEAGMLNLIEHYATLGINSIDLAHAPGAGAAGGLAGGLMAIGATVRSGMELIADVVELERHIEAASLVITGEGAYDEQTEHGKVVSVVQRIAAAHHRPVIVLCGRSDIAEAPDSANIYALCDHYPLDDCLQNTSQCIERIVIQFGSQWLKLSLKN